MKISSQLLYCAIIWIGIFVVAILQWTYFTETAQKILDEKGNVVAYE